MFLIYCEEDRSYLIVEEEKAIFEDNIRTGENIQFFHNNELYTGSIIMRSGIVFKT